MKKPYPSNIKVAKVHRKTLLLVSLSQLKVHTGDGRPATLLTIESSTCVFQPILRSVLRASVRPNTCERLLMKEGKLFAHCSLHFARCLTRNSEEVF